MAGRLARVWTSLSRALGRLASWAGPTFGYARGQYLRARTLGMHGASPQMLSAPARSGGSVDGGERREEDTRPVKQWSYATIRQAALLADDGEMRYVAELCETLMGDERIGAKLEDRALALTGAPIAFEQAPKGRQRRAALRAAQAEEDWYDMVPETELAMAVKWRRLLGFVFLELVWVEPDPTQPPVPANTPNVSGMARIRHGRNVPRVKVWHPRHFRWDWIERCWYLRLDGGYEERVTPGLGKWVMWGDGSRPWQNGLWRGLAIVWLLKTLAGPAWGRQSERHANGTAIMSGPEAYDAELRRQLTQEWQQLGSAGVIWVPEGSKLEVFELQANTWQTYQAQINTANTAIDIAIMGANLPTEVSQGAGTGATAQMATVQKRTAGDAREWETVEHYQIAGPWAKANFGTADVAPWAIRNVEPPADLAQLATTQKTAAEGLRILRGEGAPINEVEYLQQFKFPIDKIRVGARAKPALFAWHITSSMLTYGEARARYDETLEPTSWDDLRFADTAAGGSAAGNEAAINAFRALIAAAKENEPKGDA